MRVICPSWICVCWRVCLFDKLMVQLFMFDKQKGSKREGKMSKVHQREIQDLQRDIEALNRRYGDNQHHQSDDENQFVDKKGKKWWARFEERHFPIVSERDLRELKEGISSGRLQISPKQSLLLSYAQERILNQSDLFSHPQLITVLFHSQKPPYRGLLTYELEQVQSHLSAIPEEQLENNPFRILSYRVPQPQTSNSPLIPIQELHLQLVAINDDPAFCKVTHDYQKLVSQNPQRNQVDIELMMWEKQLISVANQNKVGWEGLIKALREEIRYIPASQQQIGRIQQRLMWVTILKYFQHGHADKTMQMLQLLIDNQKLLRPAKGNDTTNKKKLFQTDCKICFCSANSDSNQVLYCDQCNTSFHLACYGLKEIPKEDKYYCDCCRLKKTSTYKRPICQICSKPNFPMKQLDKHYYHVTCLILLNLVRIKGGSLALRDGYSHSRIVDMVVDSQIERQECQFCAQSSGGIQGYRLRCSHPLCPTSAHPICAYINGCSYNLRRDQFNQKLQVKFVCNNHDDTRDVTQQTYIRRYMCNLNQTSSKSFLQFRKDYEEQSHKKHRRRSAQVFWDVQRIINKTRFLTRHLRKQDKTSNNDQAIRTETGQVLKLIYKKKL